MRFCRIKKNLKLRQICIKTVAVPRNNIYRVQFFFDLEDLCLGPEGRSGAELVLRADCEAKRGG